MFAAYPVTLTPTDAGRVMAQFDDVPEAMTEGRGEQHVLFWAQDALVVALAMIMDDGQAIPKPSVPKRGQPVVPLPTLIAAKLAIYQGMLDQGLSQLAMAERLACDPRQVRRLLELAHQSRMDHVEAALRALGKALIVDVRDLTAI